MLFEVTPENEKYMTSVPFTLEFYKIPVIGLSPRSSVLSNTVSHDYPSPRVSVGNCLLSFLLAFKHVTGVILMQCLKIKQFD